ncbi:MAG: Arm DNA-binding domain-containing protein [Deltaproteobacteria bacterium]|nr:Arm DNA-binding domain-containing protein [Deltaproteobacteria bacterium]
MEHSAKLVAKVKLTLTKRTVDTLEPEDKPWIAWDDKLTGFGVRVHPSGAKSYVVNYCAGRVTPDQARRLAQELLGRVAAGDDPAGERAEARALPRLGDACEDYITSGHGRAASTERGYRRYAALYLGDWLSQPLDAITRRDVESRFRLPTERHGAMPANQCLSFLRSV